MIFVIKYCDTKIYKREEKISQGTRFKKNKQEGYSIQ